MSLILTFHHKYVYIFSLSYEGQVRRLFIITYDLSTSIKNIKIINLCCFWFTVHPCSTVTSIKCDIFQENEGSKIKSPVPKLDCITKLYICNKIAKIGIPFLAILFIVPFWIIGFLKYYS